MVRTAGERKALGFTTSRGCCLVLENSLLPIDPDCFQDEVVPKLRFQTFGRNKFGDGCVRFTRCTSYPPFTNPESPDAIKLIEFLLHRVVDPTLRVLICGVSLPIQCFLFALCLELIPVRLCRRARSASSDQGP
jgi:hypothetical protein